MGNPREVRRDFEALERRRRAAVRLVVEEGWSQSAAARQVKAAQQSVSRWVAEYRRRGAAGLRQAGRAGRKPLLDAAQRERLTALLLASVPPDYDVASLHHNGMSLSADNGEYALSSFSGRGPSSGTVERADGEPYKIALFDGKPLVFKLSNDWKGDGRKVSGITKGHFIVVAPYRWTRDGDIPVEPGECADAEYLAHYFFKDRDDESNDVGGFQECAVALTRTGFALCGERVFDDSGNGELFVGAPPQLKPAPGIVWARVGEAKEGGRRGENFKPADESLGDVLNGRQCRFYVRVYDDETKLVDSGEFRYCKDLQQIRVNDQPYSRNMLLAPSSGGHAATTLQFVGVDKANIHPGSNHNNPHAIIREDRIVEIAPRPDGDETAWTLCPGSGGVDVLIKLPRIWWRLEHNDSHSDGWRDTPLVMTREEFRVRAEADAVVRLRLPSYLKSFLAGFGDDLSRTLQVKDGLPLNHFVDDEEIDSPLQEAAELRIQCSGAVLVLIRVTADPPPPPPDPPSEPCQPEKTRYAQVNRAGGWRRGKGFSRRELLDAGLAAGDAARLGVPIDRRRRSKHRINVDNLNRARDHALRTRH